MEIAGRKRERFSNSPASPVTLDLQQRFSAAIEQMQRERSDLSFFAVDNLEKLLNAQYKHEKAAKTANWLIKTKRTRLPESY